MTLDEYIKQGEKNTFAWWLESRLDSLGSIWGRLNVAQLDLITIADGLFRHTSLHSISFITSVM